MGNLKYLNINSLEVGDIVGYVIHPTYSWNRKFRYPVVSKRKIERITPKRNKFVLEGDIELDRQEASMYLVEYDAEAERQSNIAKTFNETMTLAHKLKEVERKGLYVIENKLTDDELVAYHDVLKNICDKYIPEDEKQ
jgi:hypothetical protein